MEFSTGSSSGLGSSLETDPSAECALIESEAISTTSAVSTVASVGTDTGVETEGADGDVESTSGESDISSCQSTVSAASSVPSISLDALSVVAPAPSASTSLLQTAAVPGS